MTLHQQHRLVAHARIDPPQGAGQAAPAHFASHVLRFAEVGASNAAMSPARSVSRVVRACSESACMPLANWLLNVGELLRPYIGRSRSSSTPAFGTTRWHLSMSGRVASAVLPTHVVHHPPTSHNHPASATARSTASASVVRSMPVRPLPPMHRLPPRAPAHAVVAQKPRPMCRHGVPTHRCERHVRPRASAHRSVAASWPCEVRQPRRVHRSR